MPFADDSLEGPEPAGDLGTSANVQLFHGFRQITKPLRCYAHLMDYLLTRIVAGLLDQGLKCTPTPAQRIGDSLLDQRFPSIPLHRGPTAVFGCQAEGYIGIQILPKGKVGSCKIQSAEFFPRMGCIPQPPFL